MVNTWVDDKCAKESHLLLVSTGKNQITLS